MNDRPTTTRFEVSGDSVLVSILRVCRQKDGNRLSRYELEPSWTLRRLQEGWSIVGRISRVTDRGTADTRREALAALSFGYD